MLNSQRMLLLGLAASIAVLAFCAFTGRARSQEQSCPAGTPVCKVIIVTPQEENMLIGKDQVFDWAEWAVRPLGPVINHWRQKLATAPQGKPFMPPKPAPAPAEADHKK